MAIRSLQIKNLRIIETLLLDASDGINVFWGDNGAGKTSVLEGLYLISRGKSFRSVKMGPVIREGADCVEVVAKVEKGSNRVAGIRRCKDRSEIRIDGQSTNKVSELARLLPVQLVTPRSHELLERGPEFRRRFMDWGLFHVEPRYHGLISSYQRVLRQRNQVLKSGDSKLLSPWTQQLSEIGTQLADERARYVDQLNQGFKKLCARLGPKEKLTIALYQGWTKELDLVTALVQKQETDLEQGFTGVGCHRADLKIKTGASSAEKILSRGQQKLAVLALILTQAELVSEYSGDKPILLIDDLSAELDEDSRKKVLKYLVDFGSQVFLTTLKQEDLADLPANTKMFHVEHGKLSKE